MLLGMVDRPNERGWIDSVHIKHAQAIVKALAPMIVAWRRRFEQGLPIGLGCEQILDVIHALHSSAYAVEPEADLGIDLVPVNIAVIDLLAGRAYGHERHMDDCHGCISELHFLEVCCMSVPSLTRFSAQ
jgi:hypothetical protein